MLTKDGNIYQIKYYVKVYLSVFPMCLPYSTFLCSFALFGKAQVQLSSDTITHATAGHIVPVNHNKKVTVAVPLTTTNSVCVFVSYGGTNVDFVCQVPNQIELE